MAANSTYLPGSTKQVECYQETLMFLWKTIDINKRFRNYLLETNRVLDVVIILIYFLLEHKQDPSRIDFTRMCAFMLQSLSEDRAFGNSLNKTFDGHSSLPANVKIHNFHGTYVDYLICSIHTLVTTTKYLLQSLYPALISTLLNVSPYIKNLSPLASSKLLQLTISFGSPSFLLAEKSNHKLLGLLLDTICSILYYQVSSNPHLIYTLVLYESKIQAMNCFTLQYGLDNIHKPQYQKLETLSSVFSPHDSSNPSSVSSPLAMSATALGKISSKQDTAKAKAHELGQAGSVVPANDRFKNMRDVENESYLQALKDPKEPSDQVMSEKTRGGISKGVGCSSSSGAQDGPNCEPELQYVECDRAIQPTNSSKPTILGQNTPPSDCNFSYWQGLTTTKDVGQDGFIPTNEW
ncbi:hypothetical protein BGZ46_001649, partial [Entomortierella lignicola]